MVYLLLTGEDHEGGWPMAAHATLEGACAALLARLERANAEDEWRSWHQTGPLVWHNTGCEWMRILPLNLNSDKE